MGKTEETAHLSRPPESKEDFEHLSRKDSLIRAQEEKKYSRQVSKSYLKAGSAGMQEGLREKQVSFKPRVPSPRGLGGRVGVGSLHSCF